MSNNGKVVQISELRKEKQEERRRNYERVLFKHVLGCYTVIEKLGLKPVEMLDISKSGCSFQMPVEEGAFNQGEDIDFRFYFSNDTFVNCRLKIKRVTKVDAFNRSFWQYGATFDTSMSSFTALEKFIEFIWSYAEHAKEDKGDARPFNF